MTRRSFLPACRFVAVGFAIFALASPTPANAQTESVIHSFRATNPYDGVSPAGGLVADANGALYGVAGGGGKYGAGVVYKLVPPPAQGGAWTELTLYSFRGSYNGASDGSGPSGTVVLTFPSSRNGKIYGTTQSGGRFGGGTIYELSRPALAGSPWTETILYDFSQGVEPVNGLIAGPQGRLYGTTLLGGRYSAGTVFELLPPAQLGGAWTDKVLYNFNNLSTVPQGLPTGVILDASGSLYGATSFTSGNNAGVVYQLTPPLGGSGPWTENVLYAFSGNNEEGIEPSGGLVFDSAGALYGVTLEGGQTGASGTVYQLAPPAVQGGSWTQSVIHSFFPGFGDGGNPVAALAFDGAGALYGVTLAGGTDSCGIVYYGCGTAFKVSPPSTQGGSWTEQVLHSFGGGGDGADIQFQLLILNTSVYGTTLEGGTGFCENENGQAGCGTVFRISQP
jgi:hypothetical protein